jgi:hypothetical protein
MVRRVMMTALIAVVAMVMTGCSVLYAARYEREGVECSEFGILGTTNPEQGPPYGLLPLFRVIEHDDEGDDDEGPDGGNEDEPLYKLTPVE